MDQANMQPQQHQYYYAPGAPTSVAPPPGYHYPTPAQAGPAGDAGSGYVLPMQQQQPPQQPMMYYAPPGAAPAYAYAAPMYYQPPEAAFAALSLSGQTLLPMQQPQPQPQPQQTPGASSTTSNGSQPRAASTPIPTAEDPAVAASLGAACNPTMMAMPVMYTQMPQYYQMAPPHQGYEMPMMYQDPTTGQMVQMQPMHQQQQQQLPPHLMNRGMMSTDPDRIPENIDDISQISHHSSPDTFTESPGKRHHPSTPVSSMRRRVSLPPANQNSTGALPTLMPSNYKTRMCTQWLEKRDCTMGNSCKFAHGNEEIRLPERPFRAIANPKYKTKMCKNFEPGATGLCAYAERCEYIHPSDREYAVYKARVESLARARGDYPRYKAMFDEVPGVPAMPRRGGVGARSSGGDEENKSVRSSADSSCDGGGGGRRSPAPPRPRRVSTRDGGYLGSAMPPSMTRSAIRMGAGADAPHGAPRPMRRDYGSMYNLASGAHMERDEYRTRLSRVPSASNLASAGYGGSRGGARYAHGGTMPAKLGAASRRASLCHLNTAAEF